MGGQDSPWYGQFRMYACEAYNILRKNADLLLSLFHLMEGTSIEAIRLDPEKALLKLQVRAALFGSSSFVRLLGPATLAHTAGCAAPPLELSTSVVAHLTSAARRTSCGWTWTTRRPWCG